MVRIIGESRPVPADDPMFKQGARLVGINRLRADPSSFAMVVDLFYMRRLARCTRLRRPSDRNDSRQKGCLAGRYI
jgi:hypothetical protein